MKAKSPTLLVALALCCGAALAQPAVGTSEATARVSVEIAPHIAISAPAVVTIGLQDHPAGAPIPAQIQFQVRANTQEVQLQVACTDLYLAGDPTSASRIPVAGPGALITCDQGSPVAGGAVLLPWQHGPSTDLLPPAWTGAVTEIGIFAASTRDVFSQNVAVDVSWSTADLNLPVGEYSGFVRLIGMVQP